MWYLVIAAQTDKCAVRWYLQSTEGKQVPLRKSIPSKTFSSKMKARYSCHPARRLLLPCMVARKEKDDTWIPEAKLHRENEEREQLWEKPMAPFTHLCHPLLLKETSLPTCQLPISLLLRTLPVFLG